MKKKLNNKVKIALVITGVVLLFTAGVTATLGIQRYNDNLKAQGVSQYKSNSCSKYSNKENTQTWLECDQ